MVKAKKSGAEVTTPARLFSDKEAWAAWLKKNHRKAGGLWLQLAKKGSPLRSVSYGDALEIALCYGWIDGQKKGQSQDLWQQRFVPRSANSIWSKINREKALVLIGNGGMQQAGLEVVERAKKNGRWESAYDSQSRSVVPSDLQAALNANGTAQAFFDVLDSANRYAILFRLQTAKKPETRTKKIQQFVEMLARNEKIHEPRKPRRSSK